MGVGSQLSDAQVRENKKRLDRQGTREKTVVFDRHTKLFVEVATEELSFSELAGTKLVNCILRIKDITSRGMIQERLQKLVMDCHAHILTERIAEQVE